MRPAVSNLSRAPPWRRPLIAGKPTTDPDEKPPRPADPYLDALEAALEEAELVFTSYESPDGMSLMVTVAPFL